MEIAILNSEKTDKINFKLHKIAVMSFFSTNLNKSAIFSPRWFIQFSSTLFIIGIFILLYIMVPSSSHKMPYLAHCKNFLEHQCMQIYNELNSTSNLTLI